MIVFHRKNRFQSTALRRELSNKYAVGGRLLDSLSFKTISFSTQITQENLAEKFFVRVKGRR